MKNRTRTKRKEKYSRRKKMMRRGGVIYEPEISGEGGRKTPKFWLRFSLGAMLRQKAEITKPFAGKLVRYSDG